ncbi:phosphoheptose isomerase [Achromobacter sp. GG226]|uniref:phosphoheptose isomerase n=1 Tax=Verticiella alkaliphila TaxID=2779529 RepID=UPI001C0BC7A8|nr:phosphoheptose isomerase [Verticiella sp. GG226]MBU4612797.1 phosphoheptose isomerase [Verticiella sp. GG226]
MDLSARFATHFRDAIALFEQCSQSLSAPTAAASEALFLALSSNCKILACGNGGSAADAQHFVAELVGRFERERLPLAAVALNTDTAILTAVANDYGYDDVFARQVNALGQPGDVLVAISTSGNSPSILRAVEAAQEREMIVIALTGKGGGRLGSMLGGHDVHLCVPHERTMRIQEVHSLLVHLLCDGIDAQLLGDS